MQDWQNLFELRKTDYRGIGVYTNRAFKKGDVLEWYAGELVANAGSQRNSDYFMEIPLEAYLFRSLYRSPTRTMTMLAELNHIRCSRRNSYNRRRQERQLHALHQS